jgi:uncharacterized membrane protein YeaQ/YmgE (transglycosylase-associated protein family)
MDVILAIIGWAIFGLIVGAIARFLIPGRQPMSLGMTMVLGIIGSLAGGFVSWLFFRDPNQPYHAAGFLGSVIGAVVVLWIYIAASRSRTTRTFP